MKYAVVDLETGGLDREKCCVMEVAVIALDENFNTLGEFSSPVNVYAEPADSFEEGAIKLHRSTGLFEACMSAQDEIKIVDVKARAFLQSHGFVSAARSSEATAMILARSPEFDRAFMKRRMLEIDSFFHYRMIDIQSLVQVAAIASGLMPERLKAALAETEARGGTPHRALEDARLALKQFVTLAKHYNGNALVAELRAAGKIG